MKGIATLLSVTAAMIVLSNCADVPYADSNYDESYRRTLNDTAYSRYECRFQNHDFRYCP